MGGFSIYSSIGRHLSQKCGWAGSELYVRTHLTEPPCCVFLFWVSDTRDYRFLFIRFDIIHLISSSCFIVNGTISVFWNLCLVILQYVWFHCLLYKVCCCYNHSQGFSFCVSFAYSSMRWLNYNLIFLFLYWYLGVEFCLFSASIHVQDNLNVGA